MNNNGFPIKYVWCAIEQNQSKPNQNQTKPKPNQTKLKPNQTKPKPKHLKSRTFMRMTLHSNPIPKVGLFLCHINIHGLFITENILVLKRLSYSSSHRWWTKGVHYWPKSKPYRTTRIRTGLLQFPKPEGHSFAATSREILLVCKTAVMCILLFVQHVEGLSKSVRIWKVLYVHKQTTPLICIGDRVTGSFCFEDNRCANYSSWDP